MLEAFIYSFIYLCLTSGEMLNICQARNTNRGRSVILANPHTWKGKGVNAWGNTRPWEMGLWINTPLFRVS